ncbi:hypothetical protein BDZ89DRAFT_1133255 [Hymenopellis radicata]|nr:hypothetical protein BDZ89DRAFT_1133255 [Hymenopellis radicata]
MLPKVATTILHSSSRAASAVQNQSSTIRNVLQFQSNSGPNSNRGGNGPSSGGYKYNAGSKSYHSSGRAVSQAGIYEVNDGGVLQTDDNDDLVPQRPTVRGRRHSTSLTLAERTEQRRGPLGVLNAVKIHARSRHAFAVDSPVKTPSRRNSLSAVEAPSAESLIPPPPPPPPQKQATPHHRTHIGKPRLHPQK